MESNKNMQPPEEIGKPYIPQNSRARLMSSAFKLLRARAQIKNREMNKED